MLSDLQFHTCTLHLHFSQLADASYKEIYTVRCANILRRRKLIDSKTDVRKMKPATVRWKKQTIKVETRRAGIIECNNQLYGHLNFLKIINIFTFWLKKQGNDAK